MSISKFSKEGCFVSLMKKEFWFISFALQNYGPPGDNLVKTWRSCRVLPHLFQADLQHQVKNPSTDWHNLLISTTVVLLLAVLPFDLLTSGYKLCGGLLMHCLSPSLSSLCSRQQSKCSEETQYECSSGISFHNGEALGNWRRCDTDRHQPAHSNSSKGGSSTSGPSQCWC